MSANVTWKRFATPSALGALGALASFALGAGCRTGDSSQAIEARSAAWAPWPASVANAPLGRAECVRLAATWAPNAAAWEARYAAAAAGLRQAGKLPNPSFDLTFEDFALAGAPSTIQTTGSLAFALEGLAARGAKRAAARADLAAEEADLRAELLALDAAVRTAYDDLVGARARTALLDELWRQRAADLAATARFVELGELAPIERERAEADLAEAAAEHAAAELEEQAQELALAFALGFERPVALALADPLTAPAAAPATPEELEALLAEAATARPELKAAAARYAAERERLHLAADRLRFLPTLSFGPRVTGSELFGIAGIAVELPLFDTGAAAQDAQDAQLLAAAASVRRTAHAVAREVSAAAARVAAAQDLLDNHARGIAARRRALGERAEALFRAGEIGYFELAAARRDEVAARLALLESERAAAAAAVGLDAALGRGDAAETR